MNFYQLWEAMSQHPQEDELDDSSLEVIRTGLNIRDDFWDDFLLIVNNSASLSKLLGVPESKIGSWHEVIKAKLKKVKEMDSTVNFKNRIIKTGLPQG